MCVSRHNKMCLRVSSVRPRNASRNTGSSLDHHHAVLGDITPCRFIDKTECFLRAL